ncbi:MAG: hypothetical protein FWB90_00650 [Fibromonadales bacterium]|nr:hypothetical protein [Fibromonadales bacterium]
MKLKTKCFQMPLIIYKSLGEEVQKKILGRLIDYGHLKTAERLNRYIWKEMENA